MPDLAIPGVPPSTRAPGFYFSLVFGGTPSSAASQPRRGLLYANRITSDLTGASPAFTVSKGTQADSVPVEYQDPDAVALAAGAGSEAHRMAIAWFKQAPGQPVSIVFTPEAAGVKASIVFTFATAATAAFTIRFRLMGKLIEVGVNNGDTPTAIATACANAILAVPELPVTAQFAVGALTLTAKHPGTRGNELLTQAFFVSTAGQLTQITTSSTSSGSGTSCQISGAGAAMGVNSDVFPLSGGTVDDTLTSALAAVAASWYDVQATAQRTAAQLDALATQLYAMSAPLVGIYQQGLAAYTATIGAATTLATGRNRELLQLVPLPISPTPAEEIAAQQAALRIFGDAAAGGGDVVGEASDPACNLIGGLHATTQRPWSPADYLTASQVNSALLNGLSPLVPSGIGNGVQLVQSITTRCLKNGFPYYGTYDTKEVTVPQFVAKDMKADFATKFKAFKLGKDRPDGTPPRTPKVTSVSGVRARAAFKLRTYDEDILRNVETRMIDLVAQESTALPGRVDMFIPCEPMPNLSIIAAKITQLQAGG